jgi:hypothetical protein
LVVVVPPVVVFVVVLVVVLVVTAAATFAATLGAALGVATLGTDVADRLLGRTGVVTNAAVSTCTGLTASGNWPSPIGDDAVSTSSGVDDAPTPPAAPPEIPGRGARVVDLEAGPPAVTRLGARVGKFCLAVADSGPGPELARELVAAVETPPERAATAPTDATHLTSVARRRLSSARRCISAVMRRCRPGPVLRRCLLAACLLTGCGR